jgi:hypothetical protein
MPWTIFVILLVLVGARFGHFLYDGRNDSSIAGHRTRRGGYPSASGTQGRITRAGTVIAEATRPNSHAANATHRATFHRV